ncbi:MAG: hypothetical protein AB2745_12565 [Candidatus Thiodiazotropha endolucinida]
MLKGLKSFIALLFMAATSTTFAVHINHDRTGQVALLPYYTVNNNFITNFTVTNTSGKYKAVRVRLLDSRIGADLLNINLYLSPYDVWNATLRMNPDTGLPNLITEDESCTYPAKAGLQAGIDLNNAYRSTDFGLSDGYMEIVEMGDIADGAGFVFDGGFEAEIDASGTADGAINIAAGDRSIPMGLLHDAAGLPVDCSVVADAWAAGAESASTINGFEPGSMGASGVAQDNGNPALPYDHSHNAGLVAPSGGINAYGILINAATGAAFVQEGVHINRYATVAQHYLPDDPVHYRLPSLASGDIREAYITNALGDGMKGDTLPLTEYDTGALHEIVPLVSVPMGSNPLPIATVLSADMVSAPYYIEESIFGETDIVLTFPMRKHGIFNGGTLTNRLDENTAACVGTLRDGLSDGDAVTLPVLGVVVQDYPHDDNGNICTNAGYIENENPDVTMRLVYYDYEDQANPVTYTHESGGPAGFPFPFVSSEVIALTKVVNIVTIYPMSGRGTRVFDTSLVKMPVLLSVDYGFESGWVAFDMFNMSSSYSYDSNLSLLALTEPFNGLGSAVNGWSGVPVIGFAAMGAEVGPGQLGEVVELIRETNRN